MALEDNKVIIEVDLLAEDAAIKAKQIGVELRSLKDANKDLAKANQQTSVTYQANALAIQRLQREQKAYITISENEISNNVKKRAQLSLLNQQFDLLSDSEKDATTSGKSLTSQIQNLTKSLNDSEGKTGRFQRRVGDYKNEFNGLGNSVNQITREFPAFTNSVQTGFLAISNNLPIFFDQISQTQASIKALRAEGQQVPGLFSQLTSSIFSWGTALSFGVTLLTIYGKQLVEFIGDLFSGADAIKNIAEKMKAYNDVNSKANKDIASQTFELNTLYRAATDVNNALDDRIAAANKLKEIYPNELKNASALNIINGEAIGIYNQLTTSIEENSRARAVSDKIAEIAAKQLDIDFKKQKIAAADANNVIANTENVRQALIKNMGLSGAELEKQVKLTTEAANDQIRLNQRAQLRALDEQKAQLGNQITFLTNFAGGVNKLAKSIVGDNKEITETQLNSVTEIQKRISELNKLADSGTKGSATNNKINELKAQLKALADTSEAEERRREAARRKAEAAERKAQAERDRINEDRIRSAVATSKAILTERQREYEDINADIDKRIRLYQKYGQDTTQLENERLSRISVLVAKFHEVDLKQIRSNLNEAESVRISLMGDSIEKTAAQQAQANSIVIAGIDDSIMQLSARAALGEQGLTDLLDSYVQKRNALVAQGTLQREQAETAVQERLRAIQDAGYAADYEQMVQQMRFEQEQADARLAINEQLAGSYESLFGTIAGLAGQNTVISKLAIVAQKSFAIAEIAINAQREISAINLRYELLKTQAAAIPFAGPFLVAGLTVAQASETGVVAGRAIAASVIIAAQTIASLIPGKARGGLHYESDGNGALLRGPGNGTSDSMNARLSNGEVVINARSASMFRPELSAMNEAGGGVRFARGGQYGGTFVQGLAGQVNNSAAVSNAVMQAMKSVQIVTLVTDIATETSKQNKVVQDATF